MISSEEPFSRPISWRNWRKLSMKLTIQMFTPEKCCPWRPSCQRTEYRCVYYQKNNNNNKGFHLNQKQRILFCTWSHFASWVSVILLKIMSTAAHHQSVVITSIILTFPLTLAADPCSQHILKSFSERFRPSALKWNKDCKEINEQRSGVLQPA